MTGTPDPPRSVDLDRMLHDLDRLDVARLSDLGLDRIRVDWVLDRTPAGEADDDEGATDDDAQRMKEAELTEERHLDNDPTDQQCAGEHSGCAGSRPA